MSRFNFRWCDDRISFLWFSVLLWTVFQLLGNAGFATAATKVSYEAAPVLQASKILAPDILAGPNHRVEERVTNDGYLNIYRLSCKFGTMTVVSTPLLRKRIGEINAMVRMEEIKGTKEFGTGLKQAGQNSFRGFKNLIIHPIDTVSGTVQGIGAAGRRAYDSVAGYERSQDEESRVKDLIGFSKAKRDLAYELDVDVYSRNDKMQDMLNDLAWANYAGGITWAGMMAAVPGGAGVAITVSGTTRLLNDVFRNTPPSDLRRMNDEKLKAMGVHPEIADAYLNNSLYSPREQTLLVYALEQMKGVADRSAFIRLAALTNNVDMASFRERQAKMYVGYNRSVTPLDRFISLGEFTVARDTKGALVFNLPLDHLVWTQSMARLIEAADKLVNSLPGVKAKEMWLAGTLSARARRELVDRGWQVEDQREEQLLNWVEAYPKYEKPEERAPAAFVSLRYKSVSLGIGASWGDGVLTYRGKDYPISIKGLNLVDIGASEFRGVGKVYDLKAVGNFAGTYAAAATAFAIRGGTADVSMRNAKGVTIVILADEGKESGTRLNLGASGVSIKFK
jgi:hypothetical protein